VLSRSAAPELPAEGDAAVGDEGGLGDLLSGDASLARTPSRPNLARSALPRLARSTTRGANALAPAVRPVNRHEGRPNLQLVRPESTPAEPTISRAAERLADATGGALEQGEGGLSTVHFPPPGSHGQPVSLTHQPYTVSRVLTEGGGSPAPPANAEEHTPTDHPAGEPKEQMDPETMYEYFLERFKRDLLIEREQLGHLLIDNP
jgi:hypothetical protein